MYHIYSFVSIYSQVYYSINNIFITVPCDVGTDSLLLYILSKQMDGTDQSLFHAICTTLTSHLGASHNGGFLGPPCHECTVKTCS